jgi:heme exporter protein B
VSVLFLVLRRDIRLAWRRPGDALNLLFFFLVVVSLFPLGVGAAPELLRQIAPGVLWVSALLASMLGLPHLFASDFQDGSLEQLFLVPGSPVLVVLGKVLAHWLVTGLPLVILSPLVGLQYDLATDQLWVLALALLLGTPALSLLGAIGAGLTLGVRGGGVLLGLLVLPLYIPVLIFGSGASVAHASGLALDGHFSILLAWLILALCLAPWATAAALQLALD